MNDAALAAKLAEDAGRILLDVRRDVMLGAAALGQVGDRAANRFLMDALRAARPDDAVMCEEERDSTARLSASRVWIVDPLDGTREFGERRGDWAVHVGLAIDGAPTVGAVALPALSLVFSSAAPPALSASPPRPRMVISRSRATAAVVAAAEALGAELIPMGSAGAKAMAVVRGEAEIYLHDGGQHEWDNCAPVAVAAAAGLHVSQANGASLVYNRRDTLVPDLLICRAEWAARTIAAYASSISRS